MMNTGLVTDFYQLTMAQGLWRIGAHDVPCVFDRTYRNNPFGGGTPSSRAWSTWSISFKISGTVKVKSRTCARCMPLTRAFYNGSPIFALRETFTR